MSAGCLIVVGIISQEAPATWITNPANGHLYRLTEGRYWGIHDESANVYQPDWFDAEAESWGGHLVTINDPAENHWLIATFGANQEFWIGLTDWGSEGIRRWVRPTNRMRVTTRFIILFLCPLRARSADVAYNWPDLTPSANPVARFPFQKKVQAALP